MDQVVRQRTVSWEDPNTTAEMGRSSSGLEFLAAIRDGRVPTAPIAYVLGMKLVEVEEGRTVFTLEPSELHYNPIGVVHGGIAATLLDSCMGCSVHSTLPKGRAYTTLEFKINLVRPITLGTGIVRAEGKVIHAGRQTATAEGRLVDEKGRLYAHATTTCIIFDLPPQAAKA